MFSLLGLVEDILIMDVFPSGYRQNIGFNDCKQGLFDGISWFHMDMLKELAAGLLVWYNFYNH